MRVEDIQIHGLEAGRVVFPYRAVRRVQTQVDAATPFHPAPTREQADARLRQLAASLGADAVIDVLYQSGASWSSWKSLKATGLAVIRDSGNLPEMQPPAPGQLPPEQLPPLKTATSPRQIVIIILFVLMLAYFIFAFSRGCSGERRLIHVILVIHREQSPDSPWRESERAAMVSFRGQGGPAGNGMDFQDAASAETIEILWEGDQGRSGGAAGKKREAAGKP